MTNLSYCTNPYFMQSFPLYNGVSTFADSAPAPAKEETYEEKKARINKEIALKAETESLKRQINTQINQVNEQLQSVENSKRKDGSSVLTVVQDENTQKPGFWTKTIKGIENTAKGALNTAAQVVGFDGPGFTNWSPVKTLKNAAITIGTTAAIAAINVALPGAGAVITTALLCGGAGLGFFNIGKGIVDAAKADTEEETDNAYQKIGAGIFVTAASMIGLKSIGKTGIAARAAAADTTSAAAAAVERGGAAAAADTTAALAQTAETTASRGGFFSYLSGMTKSLLQSAKNQIAEINPKNIAAGTKSIRVKTVDDIAQNGKWNTFKKSLTPELKGKTQTQKFEEQKQALLNNLGERISELDRQIAAKSGDEQTLLELQKTNFERIASGIQNAKTRTQWADLAKTDEFEAMNGFLGEAIENAQGNNSLLASVKQLSRENKELISKLQKLNKTKIEAIQSKAWTPKKYKTELDEFIEGETVPISYWYKPTFGNDYQKICGGSNLTGSAWLAAKRSAQSGLYYTTASNPYAAGINGWYSTNIDGLGGFVYAPVQYGQVLSAEETVAALKELQETKAALQEELNKLQQA